MIEYLAMRFAIGFLILGLTVSILGYLVVFWLVSPWIILCGLGAIVACVLVGGGVLHFLDR
jgi:hypothetical protein